MALGTGNNTETFRINIEGNAAKATQEIAASARFAAQSIDKYEADIKNASQELRRLRGNSDEVTAAKTALKKKIDDAKTSVSTLTVELNKQGVSYKSAADAAKKFGDSTGRLPNLRKAGGKITDALGASLAKGGKKVGSYLAPVTDSIGKALAPLTTKLGSALAPLSKKFGSLGASISSAMKPIAEDAKSILPDLSSALGLVAEGSVIAAAAIAAVGAAALVAAGSLGKFILASADSAAKAQRQRLALGWAADDAQRLGAQIQVLAGKVPQGTAEISELANELSKTRLSGKAAVSTLNAVSQVTGAIDATAGNKIKELLTRGQLTGRAFINPLTDLQGTGIDFQELAQEYAKGTKKSVAAAQKELVNGQASIEDASAALAKVAEKKFGKLNIANAFSLENAPKKFKEQFAALTAGVDLGPITKALHDAFGQLDPNAPLGSAIHTFFTDFGSGLVDIAAKAIPMVVDGLKILALGALKTSTFYYNLKADIADAFKGPDGGWINLGKTIIKDLFEGMIGAIKFADFDVFGNLGKSIKAAFLADKPTGGDLSTPGTDANAAIVAQGSPGNIAAITNNNSSTSTNKNVSSKATNNTVNMGGITIHQAANSPETPRESQERFATTMRTVIASAGL